MPEYANLKASHEFQLEAGQSGAFEFGPVRVGEIRVDPGVRHDIGLRPHLLAELISPSGEVVASSEGGTAIVYQVPTRPEPSLTARWKLRVTNTGDRRETVVPVVTYPSRQEVATQDIPLIALQRKFDELVNLGVPPVVLQMDSPTGGPRDHRDRRNRLIIHYASYLSQQLGLPPTSTILLDPIEVPHAGNDIFIRDLNTKQVRITARTVRSRPQDPWHGQIHVTIDFEDEGVEVEVNNAPNVDLRFIGLTVDVNLLRRDTRVSYEVELRIDVDASVDVPGLRDITAHVKSLLIAGVTEELAKPALRDKVENYLTRLFAGGERVVLDVTADEHALHVKFVKPLAEQPTDRISPDTHVEPGPDSSAGLRHIEHIVVLMMENRSFDHMLGYLSLQAGRDVEGLRGGESNQYNGRTCPSYRLPETAFPEGPCHEHECVARQLNGGDMGGFVLDFAKRYPDLAGKVMGYYDARHLPVYDILAREFGICDHWFCSLPTSTWPNRHFFLTGQAAVDAQHHMIWDTPDTDHFGGWDTTTIFDHLSRHQVQWKVYEHDVGFVRLFNQHKFDAVHVVPFHDTNLGFAADCAAGRLPRVAYIEPNYVDVPGAIANDDHAPANIKDGQQLVARIYNALVASPLWPKTMLVITYDEHGGFYDHVTPPKDFGPRVPAFVISPWVPAGAVAREQLDHTAVLQTIIRRFMPGVNMGARVLASRDLGFMLTNQTARADAPAAISPTWPPETHITIVHSGMSRPSERVPAHRADFRTRMTEFRAHLLAERGNR
jgi:phospholipase C